MPPRICIFLVILVQHNRVPIVFHISTSFYVSPVMTALYSSSLNGHIVGNNVGPIVSMSTMNGLSTVSSTYVNPAQMSQNAQAGPSSANGLLKKKVACPNNGKRRRAGTPESGYSSTQQKKNRDGPRKKKANRACFHCQKAHLTCDDCKCSFWSVYLLPIRLTGIHSPTLSKMCQARYG